MDNLMDHPVLLFAFSLIVLWLSALCGVSIVRRRGKLDQAEHEDLSVVLAGTLTVLGLIIGFSFSMAVTRYDQRKTCEADEANALGTEYVRAGLLPAADGARLRELLKSYLDQRILFYTTSDARRLDQINVATAQLQKDLWSAIQTAAAAQPSPIVALAASGMNDVLNSQGYTQATWRNRIPIAAWYLMGSIAICSNLLIGYGAWHTEAVNTQFLVLPLIVAISFMLIADLDSPGGGIIRVIPHNLASLTESLHPQ